MTFDPFRERAEKTDALYADWSRLYPKAYDKNETDPYTKVRCILMNGAEYEANWFLHNFARHCDDNDVRRTLAEVRRSEQQQQKRIANLKPINETVLETTISYEQLAVDLTAIMAQREKDAYVRHALDFALLEDFDHLYRYADLLNMEQGIHAERLVGKYTEIMAGRPTVSEHRHPDDDVKRFTDFRAADPLTRLNVSIITAAEQQTMNYYMNQTGFYTSDLGRALYAEIGMIEEQHVSLYESLTDPRMSWYESWLCHEYAECYLYYSVWKDESDTYVKAIWEQHLVAEISHLHTAAKVLKEKEGKEWRAVIPNGAFPELLCFSPQKEYIRDVLKNTVTETAVGEEYAQVSRVGADGRFAKYQARVCPRDKEIPSHLVVSRHIETFGKDYRYEDAPSPREELRSREKDNVTLGRVTQKEKAI